MALAPDGSLWIGGLLGRLFRLAEGDLTLTDLSDRLPEQRVWTSALAFAPEGTIFVGTDIGVFRSHGQGQTWLDTHHGLPLDSYTKQPLAIRALQFQADRLYAALTSGGIFVYMPLDDLWYDSTIQ